MPRHTHQLGRGRADYRARTLSPADSESVGTRTSHRPSYIDFACTHCCRCMRPACARSHRWTDRSCQRCKHCRRRTRLVCSGTPRSPGRKHRGYKDLRRCKRATCAHSYRWTDRSCLRCKRSHHCTRRRYTVLHLHRNQRWGLAAVPRKKIIEARNAFRTSYVLASRNSNGRCMRRAKRIPWISSHLARHRAQSLRASPLPRSVCEANECADAQSERPPSPSAQKIRPTPQKRWRKR